MNKISLLIITIFATSLVSAAVQWGDETSIDFSITSGAPICIAGTEWLVNNVINSSLNDCYRLDGYSINGPTPNCCPADKTCNQATKQCVANTQPITRCQDYDEDSCGSAGFGIATRTLNLLTPGVCPYSIGPETIDANGLRCHDEYSNCTCVWNSTAQQCRGQFKKIKNCNEISIRGYCQYLPADVIDYCGQNGTMTVIAKGYWVANQDPNAQNCPDKATSSLCGSSVTQVPFFTWFNLIIALVVIGLIYYVMKKDKKKRKK